jgi:hypothetical protein
VGDLEVRTLDWQLWQLRRCTVPANLFSGKVARLLKCLTELIPEFSSFQKQHILTLKNKGGGGLKWPASLLLIVAQLF